MSKIVTVIGARPQFIKAAVVSRILRQDVQEVLVHTGQHYDHNMSQVFFEELDIPTPNYNLGISGGTHGIMTARMLMALEDVLIREKPKAVLIYGDTNSTLAAALAAAKLHIPICHVEAGNRLGTLSNPEEINRICTDHISSLLLACTESALQFLAKEGLLSKSKLVGDPMYDAFLYYGKKITHFQPPKLQLLTGGEIESPSEIYYLTCHREENTSTDIVLLEILHAMDQLDAPTIYPVHPRNKKRVLSLLQQYNFKQIYCIEPVGYLTSLQLIQHSKKIVTDSGGLQREAFFAEKQCVTIFDYVVWPETMVSMRNQLAKPSKYEIIQKLSSTQQVHSTYKPFGDGHSNIKITKAIQNIL